MRVTSLCPPVGRRAAPDVSARRAFRRVLLRDEDGREVVSRREHSGSPRSVPPPAIGYSNCTRPNLTPDLCTPYQVSASVGKKTLFLFNLNDPDNPIELAFQPRYGSIVSYRW